MTGEDENICQQFIKKFIFMMIIFFLIVLMVAGFTVAIIFTLKKKANTCTRTCMEGEKCTCPKCNSTTLLDNEKLGSDCGREKSFIKLRTL
jgi:flagellar basal body-associated protein FliL